MSQAPPDPPATGPVQLAVDELLTIDVEAEIRKLSQARLAASWQLPVELVRRALAAGARRVRVTLERNRLIVEDDGPVLSPLCLRHLASLMEKRLAPATRHAMLVWLEGDPEGRALLLLLGAGARNVNIRTLGNGRRTLFEWVRDGPIFPVVGERAEPPIGRAGNRIRLEGLSLDNGKALRWLKEACRFSTAEISVGGEPLARGFGGMISEAALQHPFEGRVGLPAEGEAARVWLLLDGVVSTHVSMPNAGFWEAAVELRPLIGRRSTGEPAELRETIAPLMPLICSQAYALLIHLAEQLQTLDGPTQHRVRALLLESTGYGPPRGPAWGVRVFPALAVGARERTWLSMAELEALLESGDGMVQVIPHGADPARYLLRDEVVLLASDSERGALVDHLGYGFQTPPLQPSRGPLAWLRTALERLGRALVERGRSLLQRGPAPLPEDALSPEERGFLAALRGPLSNAEAPADVQLCAGAGPIRRAGARWRLPRDNPTVASALRVWSREPAWLYPIALALMKGRELPHPSAAQQWRSR